MAVYRKLTSMVIDRLRRGPARTSEIAHEFHVEQPDAHRVLRKLLKKGRVHRTRLILTGTHGGNVAVVYQLLH